MQMVSEIAVFRTNTVSWLSHLGSGELSGTMGAHLGDGELSKVTGAHMDDGELSGMMGAHLGSWENSRVVGSMGNYSPKVPSDCNLIGCKQPGSGRETPRFSYLHPPWSCPKEKSQGRPLCRQQPKTMRLLGRAFCSMLRSTEDTSLVSQHPATSLVDSLGLASGPIPWLGHMW